MLLLATASIWALLGIVLLVERTFSWFGRNRRLARDFGNLAETLATLVTPAPIQLALALLGRSRCQARAPAVGLVSGPWPKRAAMTELRRKQSSAVPGQTTTEPWPCSL
jgi:hypothetical protein